MKWLLAMAGTATLASLPMVHSAMARGGFASERPWASEHIESLPLDIRRAVFRQARACGSKAAASHYFSVSIESDGAKFISLHFEDFACANRTAICNGDGCLHEVYLKSGGRHRLVFTTYADDLKMTNDGPRVGLEVSRRGFVQRFHWNGRRFAASNEREVWK